MKNILYKFSMILESMHLSEFSFLPFIGESLINILIKKVILT